MNKHTRILLAVASTLFTVDTRAADEDLRSLIKEMSRQITELKTQAKQSDARMQELEKMLDQKREGERKMAVAGIATPSVSRNEGAASPDHDPVKTAKPAVTIGDVPNTFKIPGTDTSIGIGGFTKFDANWSSVSAGANKAGDYSLFIPQIPVGPHPGENSQIMFNARESRFWFKSFTPTQLGNINTVLELDLYGSASSYTPRLRLAYGSIGNFLAGQAASTFSNVEALPELLDNGGSAGSIKVRQPLVRWTQPFTVADVPMEFQAAAEAPNSKILTGAWDPNAPEALTNPNSERYPDIIARFNYKPSWGSISLAGMARQIRYTSATVQQEAWGGAASLAGTVNVYGPDNIRFILTAGNAFGRYADPHPLNDAALDANGRMSLVNDYGALFAYQHWWSPTWRSTASYGFLKADQPSFVNPAMTRQAQTLHANLLWSPLKQATFGLEYIYGTRELVDRRDGSLHRTQFSAQYHF
ncbi:MAG: DcaP family trimeric outer membrane transporter [Gammaproteobacteria bacterium]